MATENEFIVLGTIQIDTKAAEARLKEIKKRIAELTEEFGSSPEVLQKVLEPLNEEYEELSSQLKNIKDASEEANQSFKSQTKGLNDLKDVTDFAGQATKNLGLDETALGSAVSETTGFIGKSIIFIKNAAKALDVLKGSNDKATASTNKFSAALTALIKHPILILLSGIAATAAIVYKRFSEFTKGNFDKRLGVIERSTELLNEKLSNQITILNALGARQSTITKSQISNLEDLNKHLETTRKYYQEMWGELDSDNNLGYMANEYLKGNKKLIEDLSDEEQELVKRFAEAGEEIRKNNQQLEVMQGVMLKISSLNDEYELSERKINIDLTKQLNIINRRQKSYENTITKAKTLGRYTEDVYKAEQNAFNNEQQSYDIRIKFNNDLISAEQKRLDGYLKLKAEIMSTDATSEKDIKDINLQLSAVDDNISQIKDNITLINEENKNLQAEKYAASEKRRLDYIATRLEDIRKINEMNLDYSERQLRLSNQISFGGPEGVAGKFPIEEYFKRLEDVYKEIDIVFKDFSSEIEKNADYAGQKAGSVIEKLRSAISAVNQELSGKDSSDPSYNSLVSRLDSLVQAYQNYMQVSSQILSVIDSSLNEVFNITKERVSGALGVFGAITPTDGQKQSKIINTWISQVNSLEAGYSQILNVITAYNNGLSETDEEFKKMTESWEEWQIAAYNQFKNLNTEGIATINNIVKSLSDTSTEWELEGKRIIAENMNMQASYMQEYSNLGNYTIQEMKNMELEAIESEKDYYDTLLQENGEYYNKLIQAGLNQSQAEEILGQKRIQVEQEVLDKKAKLNEAYNQMTLNAVASTAGDLNSIAESLFEDNKAVRGATLIASTIADAAATYGSVFAQAAGGVAAKTVQAGIASAAVLARGYAAYNKLQSVNKNSSSEAIGTGQSVNTFSAEGIESSSVARTLISSRYQNYDSQQRPVLVLEDLEYKQKIKSNGQKLEIV